MQGEHGGEEKGEREILEWLHSAKSTGGSIRNIWVWGGQGGFCLQAAHWPDTSPRFSGFLHRRREGEREGRGGEKAGGAIREGKVFAFLHVKFVCSESKPMLVVSLFLD